MSIRNWLFKAAIRKNRRACFNKNAKGEKMQIPRPEGKPVTVFLCRPQTRSAERLPVLFNIHGGAWVGCDATQQDGYCHRMAEKCGGLVVNINYHKVDEIPFPNPQREVVDVVQYFAAHAEEFYVDPARFTLIGYSAGGHLAACAAILLAKDGFRLNSQIPVYPFLDFGSDEIPELNEEKTKGLFDDFSEKGLDMNSSLMSPVRGSDEELRCIAPCRIIVAGKDLLKPHGGKYYERLYTLGCDVKIKCYDEALHGFIEVNNPGYERDNNEAKSPEQEAIARQAEDYIAAELRELWGRGESL